MVLSLTEPSLTIAVQELLPSLRLALGHSVLMTSPLLETWRSAPSSRHSYLIPRIVFPFLSSGLMVKGIGLFLTVADHLFRIVQRRFRVTDISTKVVGRIYFRG